MTSVDPASSLKDLLQLLANDQSKNSALSEEDKQAAIDLVKAKAIEELEYGQEVKTGKVRVIKGSQAQ